MWKSGNRPAYSPISTKLGELIVSRTPRPAPKPFANTVLPAPRSPQRHTTSPGSAATARRAAKSRVASGLELDHSSVDRSGLATRASGKALEVPDRHRHGRAATEPNERRLERDAGRKAARTGKSRPRALHAGEGPRAHA